MRRLARPSLPAQTSDWLRQRQRQLDESDDPNVGQIWERYRREMNANGVVTTLGEMTGRRLRCMYCGDSAATDIDHHRPKRRFPERAFVWENFLLVCGACNRRKGERFPMDHLGNPLLIDPTVVDPWDHLFLVTETGMLTPRFDAQGNDDPLGAATLDPAVTRLTHEAVVEARLRAWRALKRAVTSFLNAPSPASFEDLREAFKDSERPDVVVWVLEREGIEELPFVELRRTHAEWLLRLRRELYTPPK